MVDYKWCDCLVSKRELLQFPVEHPEKFEKFGM